MKKQEQKNKTVFHAAAALLAVLAVVLVLYGGGRWLEKRAEKPETRTQLPQADQETVEVDGVTYRKKSRMTTILVMGVDHDTQDSYEYRKAGLATSTARPARPTFCGWWYWMTRIRRCSSCRSTAIP